MFLKFLAPSLLALVVAGCASPPAPKQFSPALTPFPSECLVVQRVMFNAIGRQFPLNGYLAMSDTRGKRLIVTESFGGVMADLLIKPDGTVFVMQSSRMFPAHYMRSLMATDVQYVFGGETKPNHPFVTMLTTNHFVVERTGYKLDLRILETKPGAQPDSMFDETLVKK